MNDGDSLFMNEEEKRQRMLRSTFWLRIVGLSFCAGLLIVFGGGVL